MLKLRSDTMLPYESCQDRKVAALRRIQHVLLGCFDGVKSSYASSCFVSNLDRATYHNGFNPFFYSLLFKMLKNLIFDIDKIYKCDNMQIKDKL